MNNQAGMVQTVLGNIEPDQLGVTHTHEHLLIDLACYHLQPDEASLRAYVHAPISIDMLSKKAEIWRYHQDNRRLWSVETAVEEALLYKYAGGSALVDATSVGIARDPLGLARVSRATGLHVIMGASYYVPFSHPPDMDTKPEDEIAEQIIRDITVGVGETGVRSGVIGEIGCWWPLTDNVRKVLRASAHAQVQTGAPILIHPGYHDESHDEIMEVLVAAGADPKRVVMGHLDHTRNDLGALRALAETGCFMEYDAFGGEDTSGHSLSDLNNVSDVQRMDRIQFLMEHGHGDQILLSQDVCTKGQLVRYGGRGYAHILENIVPRMRRRGFTEAQIHAMLVDNPRRELAFA